MLLHVQPLSVETTDYQLERLFEEAGSVVNCDVVADGSTGISKAIGFTEMATENKARKVVDRFNGQDLAGRTLYVSQAD